MRGQIRDTPPWPPHCRLHQGAHWPPAAWRQWARYHCLVYFSAWGGEENTRRLKCTLELLFWMFKLIGTRAPTTVVSDGDELYESNRLESQENAPLTVSRVIHTLMIRLDYIHTYTDKYKRAT